jgi:2-polyprenyl-3-methyl-5-hydroxy-6-metoxy-1,4-benzoquinol methylase
MKTKNKKLQNKKNNREHYTKSDGHFMPLQQAMKAHQHIDRIAWARQKIHELESTYHLDVGCKDGYLCLTLAAEGIECLGLDPCEDAIEEALFKASQAKLDCSFRAGFIEDLPQPAFTFDTVSALEVLEHVVDPKPVLEKLARLAHFVLISTPDYYGRHGWEDAENNEEHVRIYKQSELEKVIKKYGEIKESVVRDDQICILFRTKI